MTSWVKVMHGIAPTSSICRRESSVRPVRSVSCTSEAKACVIAGVSTVGDSRLSTADTLGFEGSSAKYIKKCIHLLFLQRWFETLKYGFGRLFCKCTNLFAHFSVRSTNFKLRNTELFIRNGERAAIECVLCHSQIGGASCRKVPFRKGNRVSVEV